MYIGIWLKKPLCVFPRRLWSEGARAVSVVGLPQEMRINFKKQMQATMAKAQEVLEKSTSEEKAKKAAGFMSMAFQNAKVSLRPSVQNVFRR